MATKFDGVIEAVRYDAAGKILVARGYERRGATFSDHILFSRETLLERLKKGKKFITGTRKEFFASTFEAGKNVSLVKRDNTEWISTGKDATRDLLEDVPLF